MNLELTGAETGDQLIKQLVHLRYLARRVILNQRRGRMLLDEQKQIRDRVPPHVPEGAMAVQMVATLEENQLQLNFMEIEIGKFLVHLCPALDQKVSREAIFDAINTNKADRATEAVRKYGDKASHLICVLDLENSATRDDGIEIRPLKWCHTMAFMNALKTSPKLDRIVHDGANEFFNGAFGEYRERPLMERLVGKPV
jgi:hypothetical protein